MWQYAFGESLVEEGGKGRLGGLILSNEAERAKTRLRYGVELMMIACYQSRVFPKGQSQSEAVGQ